MSKKYKYFVHGGNGKDDDIVCTHPLVNKLQLVKHLQTEYNNGFPLPMYQVIVYLNNKKDVTFGGEFISSALEVADNYLKNVFPFDTFVIISGGKEVELSNDFGASVTIMAKVAGKSVSQIIESREFIKLIATTINNIAASEPCGEVKTLLEIFMETLSKK